MIRKLAHVCLQTDDLPRLLDFYHAKLGLPIKFPFINKDGETFGYYLASGDTTFIEIFDRVLKAKQWGGDEPLIYGNRLGHFCLEVTGLKEFKTQLESRGVKLNDIQTGMDHALQMWTNDPDGNPIELMEYTAAAWQLLPDTNRPRD
jgi:catechol 2,3-dioxygenase-like lactoylglutathione lyase family enzyme